MTMKGICIAVFCLGLIAGSGIASLAATTHWPDRNNSAIRLLIMVTVILATIAFLTIGLQP